MPWRTKQLVLDSRRKTLMLVKKEVFTLIVKFHSTTTMADILKPIVVIQFQISMFTQQSITMVPTLLQLLVLMHLNTKALPHYVS